MADLTEIEKAWCEWMRRFRGNRAGEPAPVTTFAAGAAYERARIRAALLEWLKDHEAYVYIPDLQAEINRILPGEG